MSKKQIIVGLVVASALSLNACSDMSKQDTGVITGGAIGGLVGSQFGQGSGQVASAIAGTLVGAVIGGAIGGNMDKTDKLEAQQALENQTTGSTSSWKNPDSGDAYKMTPTKTHQEKGHPCRNFTMVVTYDNGQTDTVNGTACREDNGAWQNK